MSRTIARDCGFKLVFQEMFSTDFVVDNFFDDVELSAEEKDYALSILSAVKQNKTAIDEKLQAGLKKPFSLKDIYTLDHAILLVAMAQIDYLNEEKGIAINEAVKLAKKIFL